MPNAVSQKFQELIDALTEDCTRTGQSLRGLEQLRWVLGDENKPGKFEFENLRKLFDRTELEEQYEKAKQAGTTRQSAALATNLSDIMSGLQRDFAMRQRTRIRRLAHETVYREHIGSSKGYFVAGLLQYVLCQMQRAVGKDT